MRSVRATRLRHATLPLATAALLVTGTATTAAAAETPFDVTAYDVTVDYSPADGVLRGSALITAKASARLTTLTLQLDGPEAHGITVDGTPAASSTHQGDLVITPVRPVERGAEFRVRVGYAGKPGGGWLTTESGGATAFEGAAQAWFPIGDKQDNAEFRLTTTVPDGWQAISVGREERTDREGTVRWTEPVLAPRGTALSVDRFTVERSTLADGTPVVNAYAPGTRQRAKPLADRQQEITDFLADRYGPYPFAASGNVFVHVNDDGPGTSPQTRPVYLGARSKWLDLHQVVHEHAHQWYGVSAAPRRAEDNCLSECFASHSTWLWAGAKEGVDLDARYRALVETKRSDPAFWRNPLYQPGRTPGFEIYERGPLALHALQRRLGSEPFNRLLREWPRGHRAGFPSWPQFEDLAERVSGQDLTGFFQAWFRGTTVPPAEYL
ncbi:aminopeptidase N [Crossiella equi]|uniref:Aminopeptidase N n=1 Tax=Crossiella equi TaxID=130796 RepID=A0ABS5A6W0_9PSEU|nr:hypothetical protein [Crossiella equi]MBP2472286.1 aminopeptidase N [Crossiella equi]